MSNDDDRFEQGAVPVQYSGWANTPHEVQLYPALSGDIEASVLVVGAGLAGSSLALHLAERNADVAVLETRQPGWGASGRNAGHVLPTLRDLKLLESFPGGGKHFLELFRQHHTIPFDLAKKHGFYNDAVQSGYLHATRSKRTFENLKKRARLWREEQGQAVDALGPDEMLAMTGSSYFSYGVLYREGGHVNPYLFTNGMIATARKLGARIFGNSEALSVATVAGGRWCVKTAHGSVLAEKVVFCTNAYPTQVVPGFANNFYPLTSYALCTAPLSESVRAYVMPSRAALSQEPVDLNPLVVDGENRMITASIPTASKPADAKGYFERHLRWFRKVWPLLGDMDLTLQHYWTGRVALRDVEFPGVFQMNPGLYGLMHFNAWGNVMAPLMGMIFADHLARDSWSDLPFPLESPHPVAHGGKQSILIRNLMIPAARLAQRVGAV